MILGRVDTGGSCAGGCVHTRNGKCRECGHVSDMRCFRCSADIEAWQVDNSGLCVPCEEARRLEDRALVAAFRSGDLREVCAWIGRMANPRVDAWWTS